MIVKKLLKNLLMLLGKKLGNLIKILLNIINADIIRKIKSKVDYLKHYI
jgi:hypothetical protein